MGFGPSDRGPPHPARFGVPPQARSTKIWTISAQALTSSGAAIVGAQVVLLDGWSLAVVAQTTSDSTGAYTFNPPTNNFYRVVVIATVNGIPMSGISNQIVPV